MKKERTTSAATFESPDLGRRLDAMTRDEIDALPFGVLKVDPQGRIAAYSRVEAAQAGYTGSPLGIDFAELAPCMDTAAFRRRIETAARQGDLDIEFEHVGDFRSESRALGAYHVRPRRWPLARAPPS